MKLLTIFRSFLEPAKYYIGPVWLNKMGFQPARVFCNHMFFKLRPRKTDNYHKGIDEISKRGIVSLNNFLMNEDYSKLCKIIDQMEVNNCFKTEINRNGSGVTWVHGAISSTTDDGKWVINKIAKNSALINIVEAVSRRKLYRTPQVIFQRLEVPLAMSHQNDVDATLHADRHFVTLKAYFCLNENCKQNGAYIWCDGSHKITKARLLHEYDYSIREANFRRFGTHSIDDDLKENNRNTVSSLSKKQMNLQETVINTPPNTMVISNNCGFHKRGTISPGEKREQLRLVFHYLEEPLIARMIWSLIFILVKRNLFPSSWEKKLADRGLI